MPELLGRPLTAAIAVKTIEALQRELEDGYLLHGSDKLVQVFSSPRRVDALQMALRALRTQHPELKP